MDGSGFSERTLTEIGAPCGVGECASCGVRVLITDPDGTDPLEQYGPREACTCGSDQFRRVSVDEALR